jgi:hypothetical protein
MEYIDMKRLAAVPSIGMAGLGRPPADHNRATTTANGEGVSNVPTQPPMFMRCNTEFCTANPANTTFVALTGGTITYEGRYNSDGKVSFRIIDANGTAEIKMTDTVDLERTYQFMFIYAFDPAHDSPPASKASNMGIAVQGRIVPTTTMSDSSGAVPFTGELGVSPSGSALFTSVGTLAQSLMCNCALGKGNCWGIGNVGGIVNGILASQSQISTLSSGAASGGGLSFGVMSNNITSGPLAAGDPHMKGFNGEDFFFNGEFDQWFNLLSAEDMQFNAYFTYWHTSGEENLTAMRKFAIMTRNNQGDLRRVIFDAENGVYLNDEEIAEETHTVYEDGFILRVNDIDVVRFAQDGNNFHRPGHIVPVKVVSLETRNYMIYMVNTTDHVNPPALDIRIDCKNNKLRAHGVIGQTSYYVGEPRRQCFGLQGEGIIEGVHTDYIVSDAWGTDFKYNRF